MLLDSKIDLELLLVYIRVRGVLIRFDTDLYPGSITTSAVTGTAVGHLKFATRMVNQNKTLLIFNIGCYEVLNPGVVTFTSATVLDEHHFSGGDKSFISRSIK